MDVRTFLYLLPVVLASLTLHELAHAWVAWRLGDPTAKREGRLTLNPVVHIDPIGTLMFVVTGLAAGLPFGWAKPVPVNPGYFRRPKEGMAIVAVAGPIMNFLIALVCFAVLRHVNMSSEAFEVLRLAWIVNVVLGIFNLIPVPPLVPVSPFPSRAPTWKPDGERRMTVRGDSWTAGEMRDWVGAGRTAASGRARLVGARR